MKKLNKKLSLISSISLAMPMSFIALNLTSCSNQHTIQFANFESYMDDGLMEHLKQKYDVQFQWFTVTEMIETKFKDTYDIAVPSGYEMISLYKKGWLEKIDWSKFNVKDLDGNQIKNSTDALNLFADDIQVQLENMNKQFNEYLHVQDFNVLDYGVPYFGQSFTFVYKGEKIDFYDNKTHQKLVDKDPTWADIFYTIGPDNPHLNNYIKNGRKGMLDDAKTLYDISRIIETKNDTNQMPNNASIDNLVNTFNNITNKAKSDWYCLNTDSGIISRNLADYNKNSYVAALTWSGDALYAAQGAGEYKHHTGDEMHVQKTSGAMLDEIEFVVLNNKNHNNQSKLDRVYNTVKDVCLDGCDAKSDEIDEELDGHYKYWSMQNWDTVSYTPMLKSIYDYATNPESNYWSEYKDDKGTIDLYISFLKMSETDDDNVLFGRTLTPLQNSNTHWAWLQSRGKL